MRKRLIVLRHAKSAWDTDALSDHDRPLNKRGRADAPRVGQALADLGWKPEWVLLSDAARTRETWKRMRSFFDEGVELRASRSLYHAGFAELAEHVRALSDTVETVMVIGHNPGWEEVASRLSQQEIELTTANAALLETAAGSWAAALKKTWTLHRVIRPKEL
jgi:phosphohistidine phosphatase